VFVSGLFFQASLIFVSCDKNVPLENGHLVAPIGKASLCLYHPCQPSHKKTFHGQTL